MVHRIRWWKEHLAASLGVHFEKQEDHCMTRNTLQESGTVPVEIHTKEEYV